jgi:hypothetical protein
LLDRAINFAPTDYSVAVTEAIPNGKKDESDRTF